MISVNNPMIAAYILYNLKLVWNKFKRLNNLLPQIFASQANSGYKCFHRRNKFMVVLEILDQITGLKRIKMKQVVGRLLDCIEKTISHKRRKFQLSITGINLQLTHLK